MAYSKTTWVTGDVITAEKLNNIENKVEELDGASGDVEQVRTELTAQIEGVETELSGSIDALDERVAQAEAAVGAPMVASTVAGMTDHTKVYVYTGSETGYTSGNWYYWNGSAWTSGGVYNAVAVDTDKTLSVANKAADGKKVGDEISELKSDLNNGVGLIAQNFTTTTGSYIDGTTGEPSSSATSTYTDYIPVLPNTNVKFSNIWVQGNRSICGYDENKQNFKCLLYQQNATVKDITITIPDGVYYVRATGHIDYEKIHVQYDTVISMLLEKTDIQRTPILTLNSGYVNQQTGGIGTDTAYTYAEISVIPNIGIKYKNSNTPYPQMGCAFYDKDGAFITGSGVHPTAEYTEIDIPSNAYLLKATINSADDLLFSSDVNIIETLGKLIRNEALINPNIVLDLPSRMTAVVGHQYNIYKKNIVWGADADDYDVVVSIPPLNGNYITAYNYKEFYRFTPTLANVGQRNVTVYVRNKYTGLDIATGTFTLHVIADTSVSNKKVLFIGDSLTEAGIYPADIQFNLSNGGIISLGSLQTTATVSGESLTVNHEGRGGWSAGDYCTQYETKNHTNAFWNPNTNKFDFSYYMTQQGYSGVDIVCLNLGTNGDATTQDTVDYLSEMITSIHSYDADIIILVSLINYGCDQNGWGTRGSASAWGFARNVYAKHKAYKEEFANSANVDFSEVYVMVDPYYDYSLIEVPASARNPKLMTIQNNTEHPDGYGYLHFADCYYNNLLYWLTV